MNNLSPLQLEEDTLRYYDECGLNSSKHSLAAEIREEYFLTETEEIKDMIKEINGLKGVNRIFSKYRKNSNVMSVALRELVEYRRHHSEAEEKVIEARKEKLEKLIETSKHIEGGLLLNVEEK